MIQSKTSTWSAVKKHVTSTSYKLEPTIWSHDTGQRITWFDRCQLIITWCQISKKYTVNQGCMSLPTYYLEHDRHVARLLRRRRRAHPWAIPLAMITMRKSIHWFPLLYMGIWGSAWRPSAAGAPLKHGRRYKKRTADQMRPTNSSPCLFHWPVVTNIT